jgi:hypothetical protein
MTQGKMTKDIGVQKEYVRNNLVVMLEDQKAVRQKDLFFQWRKNAQDCKGLIIYREANLDIIQSPKKENPTVIKRHSDSDGNKIVIYGIILGGSIDTSSGIENLFKQGLIRKF